MYIYTQLNLCTDKYICWHHFAGYGLSGKMDLSPLQNTEIPIPGCRENKPQAPLVRIVYFKVTEGSFNEANLVAG